MICDDPDYARHVVDETFAANKEVRTRHVVIHDVSHWELFAQFIYVLQAEKEAFEGAEKKRKAREEEVN